MTIDLKKLNFGPPAAERDDNLTKYFVQSESFNRLYNLEKHIALGNRGSGKTAIFEMIAQKAKINNKKTVIKLFPEDYSYEILDEVLKSEVEGSWAKQNAYAAAWKYVLFVLAMKAVTKEGAKYKRAAAGRIYTYLRDNHTTQDKNPIGLLISYLKRLEDVKIAKYRAGLKAKSLHKLYKLEEIKNLIGDLDEVSAKRPVLILVDELDRGWDSSEDAKAFVGGLFQATMSINSQMKNIRILLSLRKELYNSIPTIYDDAQKFRDVIEIIQWDEKSLLKLVAKRIESSLELTINTTHEKKWGYIFSETLDYRQTKSFNYFIDRTLYRPREIIQFCDSTREIAIKNKAVVPLNYPIISEAEMGYSEISVKD
ncbi:MAG: hypothetical protein D3923_17065, partial [Candidatus Electrothrix sp. AR3]|nr:hypothetical protein [Candidatus Electrothrix sp. AR3]